MAVLQAVPPPEGAEADVAAVEAVDVEDEEDADGGFFPRAEEADGADDEDVDAWSPLSGTKRCQAGLEAGCGRRGEQRPLAPRVQPGGPLAVVPQVADGPHAYVGAALRMVANSPPSRAFTRLQALIRQ